MSDSLGLLTAVYRDGRVHIGGKSYAAGTFAVHLLNQYYKNDTAARIAVFRQHNWNVQEQLAAGYLHETDFLKAGEEILTILKTLPKLKPFSSLDIAAEKQRISRIIYPRERRCHTGLLPPEGGGCAAGSGGNQSGAPSAGL